MSDEHAYENLCRSSESERDHLLSELDRLKRELEEANHWRDRHCRDAIAAAKQSAENWQKWKAAEKLLAERTEEIERIQRMSTTGSAQNWLKLPDADKLLTFAFAIEESARRKAAESRADSLAGRWISVEERLPPSQTMVLLHTPTSQRGRVDYGFLDYVSQTFKVQSSPGWENVESYGSKVADWQPLPAPPATGATERGE